MRSEPRGRVKANTAKDITQAIGDGGQRRAPRAQPDRSAGEGMFIGDLAVDVHIELQLRVLSICGVNLESRPMYAVSTCISADN